MSTPFLTGLLNPIIIIPERMISGKYENRIPAIFAHEVAHLISRDLIWTFIIRWFEVVLWFHPLVWKLRGVHSTLCEEVSDAVAAKYIGNTESYSSTLASLALEIIGRVQVVGAIPMARSSEIVARLRILKQRFYPARLARRWIILSGLVSFIALTVIGGINLVYAESDPGKSATRVLHFPKDLSLGKLFIRDADLVRRVDTSIFWADKVKWEYFAEARGNVKIPSGKRCWLQVTSPNAWRDLSPLRHLRPDDLYRLDIYGSYSGGSKPDDRCMQHVAALTGLKVLELRYTNITGQGIKAIAGLESLERLTLPERIDDAGMVHVAQLKSLKGLYWTENRVTNAGLRYLTKLPLLEELALGGEHIGNNGLVHVAKLGRLRYLMLWGEHEQLNDAGLIHLQNAPSLKILHIGGLHTITDVGVEHLSLIPGLEIIDFYWNRNITDRGIAYLKRLPALRRLKINNSQVTDKGLAHLKEIKTLEYLGLPNHGITDEGLAYVAQLKRLKYLSVGANSGGSAISNSGLGHLVKLEHLEELQIGGKDITDEGMSHIAKLANLKSLTLFGCPRLADGGITKLSSLKSLKKLNMSYTNVSIAGLAGLNLLPNITHLYVRSIVRDDGVLDISGLTNLEKLNLSFESGSEYFFEDVDMACLAKLKKLKNFQMGDYKHSMITDAGVACLKNLTNMEILSIGSRNVTDKSLSYFTNMKKLNALSIIGNFTDDGLVYLEQLKGLNSLRIYSANNFSPKALQRLQRNLPNMYPNSFRAEQDRDIKKMTKNKPEPSTNNTVAPSFAVKTLDGRQLNLKDYRGKVVILYFWAMWCRPCVAGTPKLKKFYRDLKSSFGDDFEMISLSMDENEQSVRRHVKKYKLTWPQVRIGLHSKISSDYGVNDSAPQSFLIGPDGKILLTPESPQVDTKSFIEELLKNRKL